MLNATTSRARLARLFASAPAPCRAFLRWALSDAGRARYIGLPALAAQLTPLDAGRDSREQREAEALLREALPWLARG